MIFTSEAAFEEALIKTLIQKGWEETIIKRPTEKNLLDNWAKILFENNRDIDRLNNFPLTDGEMQQILEQIKTLRTPVKLNGFINGKSVAIKRDNPDDTLHFGKEISLKIYDRHEIAAGHSRYQIVQQPIFKTQSDILNDRRGDLMLLINGMPLFHIELKKSGVPVSQAYHQIEKYSKEGIFTGLFSLIQIFVAMEPEETKYFANPGQGGKFNNDFYFNWADANGKSINQWKDIASSLLSIPMAHQLIGFYTVPDANDEVLKVLRSYQYYAASAISGKVAKTDWRSKNILGGYIWHTTGSGKTMTSFKTAQLIASSKDADKVVFLMDRIELGTQSLKEYRGFASDAEDVQATDNTGALVTKLKSDDHANTLIVSSIQKMSNITEGGGMQAHDLKIMNNKRIVFIIDEAHRSTFGDMLMDIKNSFPSALYFGFTGTPIFEENQKKMNTTSTVFGGELHRYTIADGIRDKNVLGFDPYKVLTQKDSDLRKAVALEKAKAADVVEALSDPEKKKVFNHYNKNVKMAGFYDGSGKKYEKGIEDFLPLTQFDRNEHHEEVVKDIKDNWIDLSQNNKFHGLFATNSISDAIKYYRLIKKEIPDLKISALFDPNIDNNGGHTYKQDGLVEILKDYNENYKQDFKLASHSQFKKDIAARLAHKAPYINITREDQINLLIVVDQMLTGFDSKWLNTLYLDKKMQYESIIQAFSRTNRLFGPDKPFGTIRYYRWPHTMERNINDAVKMYSGDRQIDLFVDQLERNLKSMNYIFGEISIIFKDSGIINFEKLPKEVPSKRKFAKLFKEFNDYLEAAKIQGFKWRKSEYKFGKTPNRSIVKLMFDENTYLILAIRYKELFSSTSGGGGATGVPFEIEGHLTEIDTGRIDNDFMNSKFDKYLKKLNGNATETEIQKNLDILHSTFATLTQEEQIFANLFLKDIELGNAKITPGKTFKDYIIEYKFNAKNDQIHKISSILGLDENKLRNMMDLILDEKNINEFGRFDKLKETVNKTKAKEYFEKQRGEEFKAFQVNIQSQDLLRKFILEGGFEI
ncbi:HsdR family type I site-specific deoxyribonuclease [Polaribacter sp.]|nr:HsdR family type I site-specific deoxyribonuclease [Polaribacter sp.]